MDEKARAVVSGRRLFNTVFGLPRHAEKITRSLGTFQSGPPPGHATIRSSRDRMVTLFNRLNAYGADLGLTAHIEFSAGPSVESDE
jgi:hypothetical protein